jgi:hypothetical protein
MTRARHLLEEGTAVRLIDTITTALEVAAVLAFTVAVALAVALTTSDVAGAAWGWPTGLAAWAFAAVAGSWTLSRTAGER